MESASSLWDFQFSLVQIVSKVNRSDRIPLSHITYTTLSCVPAVKFEVTFLNHNTDEYHDYFVNRLNILLGIHSSVVVSNFPNYSKWLDLNGIVCETFLSHGFYLVVTKREMTQLSRFRNRPTPFSLYGSSWKENKTACIVYLRIGSCWGIAPHASPSVLN